MEEEILPENCFLVLRKERQVFGHSMQGDHEWRSRYAGSLRWSRILLNRFRIRPCAPKASSSATRKVHGARVSIIGECYTSQKCSQCCNQLHTVPTRCHKKIKGEKAELPRAQQVIFDLENTWFCRNACFVEIRQVQI